MASAVKSYFAQPRLTEKLERLLPDALAALTFAGGALLLFSGALPAAPGRLAFVTQGLGLVGIEVSHFAASVIGAVLLLLARGLQRRLDAAWLLAVALLACAAAASLAKGWDFEEATVLGVACAALLPFRHLFQRQSSLLDEPVSGPWIAAIAILLGGVTWLSLFAHRHSDYADQPWWHFAVYGEGPRSLRAAVGAIAIIALFALHRLLRGERAALRPPNASELQRASALVERARSTHANLVYRGDKSILFARDDDAFLMYARHGRSWVAMGEPVGSDPGRIDVLRRYRELCDRHDAWCVLFEVHGTHAALYRDLGLTLTMLGEEARVDLAEFSLDDPRRKSLRHAHHKALRAGLRFEVAPRTAVPALVPELARVSAAWLSGKATREKGFSNASFDSAYLCRFPVAIVRHGGRIMAFANLWLGAEREELSVDLMRYATDAPYGTMDYLFVELLRWGHAQGFHWFNFGMAPLAGVDRHDTGLWSPVAAFLYRHGEHFYNFDGLRRYKAKFGPAWRPLYLASPGGLALPHVLLDVTALIAGSTLGILAKGGVAPARRSAP